MLISSMYTAVSVVLGTFNLVNQKGGNVDILIEWRKTV